MSESLSKVAGFRKHCTQIVQDDAGGKSSLKELENLVEQDMAKTYKIPVRTVLPGMDSSGAEDQKQLRGLWHQLTQHLVDLGYITQDSFVKYLDQRKKILEDPRLLFDVVEGTKTYLEEETASEIQELVAKYNPERRFTQFWIEQHLGVIVEAIGKYTSFDGSLTVPENYQIGDQSCYGRSLAFRIRIIFEMDQALEKVYTFERPMVKYLFSLSNILGKGNDFWMKNPEEGKDNIRIHEKFWELIADVDKLFGAFYRALPDQVQGKAYALSYIYRYTKDSNGTRVFKAEGYQLIFQDRSAENNKGHSRKWSTKLINNSNRLTAGIYANLACRLLQLKLWQTSFYLGAIDGAWGEMSHDAVLSAYEHEVDICENESNKHTNLEEVNGYSLKTAKRSVFTNNWKKTKNKKSVLAISLEDMHQILQNYISSNAKDEDEEKKPGENEMNFIEKLGRQGVSHEKLDETVLTEKNLQPYYKKVSDSQRKNRRVSYVSMNNKSFYKGLVRGIVKVVNWIVKKVKKILGLVFSFAKAILDRIRKGFQLFAKGFRYLSHLLLGRPIMAPRKNEEDPPARIFTRFKLDFDAINYIPTDATPDEIKAHRATLDIMHESMMYFIDVVLFVINAIGKLSRPGGWVSLGIMIFKWLFKRVKELFQLEPQHKWSEVVA